MQSISTLGSALALAVAVCAKPTCEVETSNGLIKGHPASNLSSVTEFLGIPYAQPPIGDLRFAAPEPYEGKGSYEASEFGFTCPQSNNVPQEFPGFTPQAPRIIEFFAGSPDLPKSEDCLTLNVWTKNLDEKDCDCAEKPKRPVLVFFHGGRTAIGGSDTPFYDGQFFADAEDVVVVTVNYRLNIFGFPSGSSTATQNIGFRDQRLSLEWLRDNIEAFGGDGSQITVFGQSSGAFAIDYYSYAFVEDPIVNAIILHSGTAFSFPLNSEETSVSNWNNLTATLGCGNADNELACLREKDFQDIEDAASSLPSASGGSPVRSVPPFYPEVDGEIVFDNYVERSENGDFAHLPVLLGNNNNEQGYYVIPVYSRTGEIPGEEATSEFLLSSFTCPNTYQAANRRAAGVTSWLYRYFGDWDNTRLYPTSGAYHGVDLQMIFGNSAEVSGLPTSRDQRLTTALMQHAWALFAEDPEEGLYQLGWPSYDPEEESLILLAYNNSPTPEFVKPSEYDAPCSTVQLGSFATPE